MGSSFFIYGSIRDILKRSPHNLPPVECSIYGSRSQPAFKAKQLQVPTPFKMKIDLQKV